MNKSGMLEIERVFRQNQAVLNGWFSFLLLLLL